VESPKRELIPYVRPRIPVQDLSAFLSRDKATQLVSSLRLAAVALREERTRLACSDASGPFPGSEA
jgi:hypothetical protein